MLDAENDWVDGRDKDNDGDNLDLDLENESLELDIRIKGGELYKSEEMEDKPELYNQFLRNIMEYEAMVEEGTEDDRPLSYLFPDDFTFPPADKIDGRELDEKLAAIEEVFAANHIELGLVDGLPDELIYKYLTEEVLLEPAGFPIGPDCPSTCVIDGCDGDCPDCFQKDHCETAAEWDLEDYGRFS
ncbi:MAG: hypothetical protein FVQ82_16445 [Planctomycetes bacterium]|nr:hypothetical protein [Planctomycetota bacterium]